MQLFTEKVVTIIGNIPPGKVLTYGKIAELAGNSRGARQVSRILSSMSSKYSLPWHRVINGKGKISLPDPGYSIQKTKLEEEGIIFDSQDTISLEKYLWKDINFFPAD